MLIAGVLLMTSCIRDDDESIAKDKMEQLMATIENKDSVALRSLFSDNKLVNIENFGIKADALFSYVQGNYVPLVGVGPAAFAQKENGKVSKYFLINSDITTTDKTYKIAIIWYITDTADTGNEGIWSLYIIDKDTAPQEQALLTYWGHDDYIPGIHIGN